MYEVVTYKFEGCMILAFFALASLTLKCNFESAFKSTQIGCPNNSSFVFGYIRERQTGLVMQSMFPATTRQGDEL